MDFNYISFIHILSILFTTLSIIFITKILFLIFPVRTDRRKLINSLTVLIFFIILNQLKIYHYLPWFNKQQYVLAFGTATIIFCTMVVSTSLDYFVWNGIAKRGNKLGLPKILTNILKVIMYFAAFVYSAGHIYGMDITALVASAGILTFILGYAAKPTLNNLFSGIAIQLGGKLKKGHFITVGDYSGTITEFDWRSTTIKALRTIIIPNSKISNEEVEVMNYDRTQSFYMKVAIVPVPVYSDYMKIVKLCEQIITECSPFGKGFTKLYKINGNNWEIFVMGLVKDRSQVFKMKAQFMSSFANKINKNNLFIGVPRTLMWREKYIPSGSEQPTRDSIISAVKNTLNLNDESLQDITDIIDISSTQHFSYGENVININEPGDSMFIIISGEFTTNEMHSGEWEEMRTLESSEIFGLRSFLIDETRRNTVRCNSTDGWLLEVKRNDFKQIQQHNPEILDRLAEILIHREKENMQKHRNIDKLEQKNQQISTIVLKKIAHLFNKNKQA